MLHAVIRTPHDAFHLLAHADLYSLQTLQQHVRGARQESTDVRLQIALDAASPVFTRRMRRWIDQLSRRGVSVELHDGSIDPDGEVPDAA